jgi:hypothetical protein
LQTVPVLKFMKRLLIISSFFTCLAGHTQTISGTVTYYFNKYKGDVPDSGCHVTIVDSLQTDSSLINQIDSIQLAYKLRIVTHGENAKLKKFTREEQAEIAHSLLLYSLVTNDKYFALLNDSLLNAFVKMRLNHGVLTMDADQRGRYKILLHPGIYYIIFESVGRNKLEGFQGVDIEKRTIPDYQGLVLNHRFDVPDRNRSIGVNFFKF